MLTTKKRVHLVLFVALTILVSACGSGAKTPSSSSDKPLSSDSVLQNIAKTKTIRVGTDATLKPFEYKKGDRFEGFDIDMVEALAKELGAEKVEFVDTEFKGLIPGLQAKKFDMIASAMYITEERKKTIDFSDAYYPGGVSLLVKKENNTVQGMEDLKGKKVAVQIGTANVKFVEDNYKNIEVVKVDKNTELFLELETGKVDAVVTSFPSAKGYEKENPTTVKVLPKKLTEDYYGFGVSKENVEFTKAINVALKKLNEKGITDEIIKKWVE